MALIFRASQVGVHGLHALAGGAIDDARLLLVDERLQPVVLRGLLFDLMDAQAQVRAARTRRRTPAAPAAPSWARMSRRTSGVAVAVNAATCGRPSFSSTSPSRK